MKNITEQQKAKARANGESLEPKVMAKKEAKV